MPSQPFSSAGRELSASLGEMKNHKKELLLFNLGQVSLGVLYNSNPVTVTRVSKERVVTEMAKLTLNNALTRRTQSTNTIAPATTETPKAAAVAHKGYRLYVSKHAHQSL